MESCQRILVPTDGSPLSLKAVRHAAALAGKLHARLTAIYVMPRWAIPPVVDVTAVPAEIFDEKAFNASTEAIARAALEKAHAAARAAHVPCIGVATRDDHPWKGIVKAARKCDLVVMGSHRRTGVEALVLGSEARKVLAHSKKPVLVC